MQEELPENLIYVAEHISPADPFTIPEVEARAEMYGVSGIPDVRIDGMYTELGGSGDWDCLNSHERYLEWYSARMSETGGESPIAIQGEFRVDAGHATISATFHLVDPEPQGTLNATLFIYEDDASWCCGFGGIDDWDHLVRFVASENVVLNTQGSEQIVSRDFDVPLDWNPNKLHGVAFVQELEEPWVIVQAARLDVPDIDLAFAARVGSACEGNGTVLFEGTIASTATAGDQIVLEVDNTFGWPTAFQVGSDLNWYTSHTVDLDPGAVLDVTVRVLTNGEKRIGEGVFLATPGETGRTRDVRFRVFNGSCSYLLVDDDEGGTETGGAPYEAPFVDGLNSLGYLYDHWDSWNQHGHIGPTAEAMKGFDAVIWQTAYEGSSSVFPYDKMNLQGYLDAGGSLYLNAMEFLTGQSGDAFTHDYLGLAGWVNNSRSHTASGVTGDPITDGMVLPLSFPSEILNRVDTTNPTAMSSVIFFSEHVPPKPNAVRLDTGTFRVVFSTILQNAISEVDPAPNNNKSVLQEILLWLTQSEDPADVPDNPASGIESALVGWPNPTEAFVELAFTVQPSDLDLRLHITDATGRLVRTLADGQLQPGRHTIRWDGREDGGAPVPSGVYFARLRSQLGEHVQKVVLVK